MSLASAVNFRKGLILGIVLLALSFIFSGIALTATQKQYESYSGPTLQVECPLRQKNSFEGKGLPFSVLYAQEKGSGSCTGVSSSEVTINPLAFAINLAFWFGFSFLLISFIGSRRRRQSVAGFVVFGLSILSALLLFSISYSLKPLSQPIYRDKIVECNRGNIEFCPYATNDREYNARYEATSIERYDKGWPVAYEASGTYNVPLNTGNIMKDIIMLFGISFLTLFLISGRLGGVSMQKDKRNTALLALSFVAGVVSLPLAMSNARGEFFDFVGPLLLAVFAAVIVGYVLITSRKPFASAHQKNNFVTALILAVPLGLVALVAVLYLLGIYLLFTT